MTEEEDLKKSIDAAYQVVEDAWTVGGARGFMVWTLASAYLAGLRTRLWLIKKGIIK